jgi:Zn-dependent protease with chaperone function
VALIFGSLGYAAAAVLLAPLLLVKGNWRVRSPRVALWLWHAAFLSGLTALGLSLVWSVLLGVEAHHAAGPAADSWLEPTAVVLFAWLGLATFGAFTALVVSRLEPLGEAHRTTEEKISILTSTLGYKSTDVRGVPVTFIDCDLPFAASVPSPNRRIVISALLEDELDGPQLRAVIEHERAHLVQRHHRIAQLARLNVACLPRLLGAREFDQATQLLIELIADDTAARRCGRVVLANALAKLATIQQSESMELRARRIAEFSPVRRKRSVLRLTAPRRAPR